MAGESQTKNDVLFVLYRRDSRDTEYMNFRSSHDDIPGRSAVSH